MLENGTTGGGYTSLILDGGTLGGSGTISNPVIAGSGAHTIYPSAKLLPTDVRTLSMARLNTSANTSLKFNLVTPGASSVSDRIVVTGSNRTNISGGGKLEIGGTSTGIASLGYYKVLSYSGTLTGSIYNIVLPTPVNNIYYTLDVIQHPGFIDVHRGWGGDANDDGTVTFSDFVSLANNFGAAGAGWGGGDFNGDGTTAFSDFIILANNFGQTIGGGAFTATPEELAIMQAFAVSAAPVPEPATLSLLALAAIPLFTRRRRSR
jgi:hypothetical protein